MYIIGLVNRFVYESETGIICWSGNSAFHDFLLPLLMNGQCADADERMIYDSITEVLECQTYCQN